MEFYTDAVFYVDAVHRHSNMMHLNRENLSELETHFKLFIIQSCTKVYSIQSFVAILTGEIIAIISQWVFSDSESLCRLNLN